MLLTPPNKQAQCQQIEGVNKYLVDEKETNGKGKD